MAYIGKGSMETLQWNYTLIFQVLSASNFQWPFANNIVTGQLSSSQKFARNSTRISDRVSDGRQGSLMS